MSFEALRIHPRCQQYLTTKGITQPTPIQAKAIPAAMTGRDLVAIAQTGTGKTLAFGLPALTRLADLPRGTTRMLILAPTRELAQQVHDVLHPLAKALDLSTACVYGGVGMEPQAAALRRGTSIIIACPGRLIDHMERKNTRFNGVSILVMDEADRMLDMGFLPPIRRIISALPRERQTMMFSATFPSEISNLASTMMQQPQRVEAGPVAKPTEAVRQGVFAVSKQDKVALLQHILGLDEVESTLVFTRTKRGTDRLAKVLTREGYPAAAIHGGLSQSQRTKAIEGFRAGRHRILIATDVAARGIDIRGITHVVNYDIPGTPDDYVHRIGRTARADATGDAITFVTPEDGGALRDIERAIGKKLESTRWHGNGQTASAAPTTEPRHAEALPEEHWSAPRTEQRHTRPAETRSAAPPALRPRPARPRSGAPSHARASRPTSENRTERPARPDRQRQDFHAMKSRSR